MGVSSLKILLDFFQAIAWPSIAFVFFIYFAPLIKDILISLNKAVRQRGIKVSKTGVEIPGPQQDKMETIQDLITQQRDWSVLSKQSEAEVVEEPLMLQSEIEQHGVDPHRKNLLLDVRASLQSFIKEKENDKTLKKDWVQDLLCDAYICLYFERCYQRTLGSQLDLLSRLKKDDARPLSEREALKVFHKHYPHLPSASFQRWLKHLEGIRFIHIDDLSIYLTKEGKEFLHYLQERGYSFHKPG
jgi:hypothetical protein